MLPGGVHKVFFHLAQLHAVVMEFKPTQGIRLRVTLLGPLL